MQVSICLHGGFDYFVRYDACGKTRAAVLHCALHILPTRFSTLLVIIYAEERITSVVKIHSTSIRTFVIFMFYIFHNFIIQEIISYSSIIFYIQNVFTKYL